MNLIGFWASFIPEPLPVGNSTIIPIQPDPEDASLRRLQWKLLDGIFGEGASLPKRVVAEVLGAGTGFIANMVGSAARDEIILLAAAGGTAVAPGIGTAVFTAGGIVLGTWAAQVLSDQFNYGSQLIAEYILTDDPDVLEAFKSGQKVRLDLALARGPHWHWTPQAMCAQDWTGCLADRRSAATIAWNGRHNSKRTGCQAETGLQVEGGFNLFFSVACLAGRASCCVTCL